MLNALQTKGALERVGQVPYCACITATAMLNRNHRVKCSCGLQGMQVPHGLLTRETEMTQNARNTALVEEETVCDCTAVATFPLLQTVNPPWTGCAAMQRWSP